MGDAGSPEEAAELVKRHADRDFDERLQEAKKAWNGFLDTVQVDTPDKALDLMVNRWLPYQALACRIRARTAFYQSRMRRGGSSRKAISSTGGCRARVRACARRSLTMRYGWPMAPRTT
jgi:hypothetical protein